MSSSYNSKKNLIIDLVSPLIAREKYIKEYQKGQFSVVGVTLAVNDGYEKTKATIKDWLHRFEMMKKELTHVLSIEDIKSAQKENKLGIIFHFQNTTPLEGDVERVKEFFEMGVRIIQLTYNDRNSFGCGCECDDTGLSELGYQLIDEMNLCRMLLDVSHAGYKTAKEAIEYSKRPVVFSHSNVHAICPSDRNIPDSLIKLIAQKGGCIGINAFSPLITKESSQASLSQLIDHINYIRDLVGINHISLELDYYTGQWPYVSNQAALKNYKHLIEKGIWNSKNYPKPPHKYAKGIETPRTINNLKEMLLHRGYNEEEVTAILGGNLFSLFSSFW